MTERFSTGAVLGDTWTLYRRLFWRSALVALAVVFPLRLLAQLAGHNAGAALIVVVLTVAGTTLVQGSLVELVQDEHEGREPRGLGRLYADAVGRVLPLFGLSILVGLGVGLGLVLLIVPGLILATRWSVAVPALVLERRGVRDAMRRSRQLVRGHGWSVFWLFVCVVLLTAVFQVVLVSGAVLLGGGRHIFVLVFLAGLLATVLTTPYGAHALNAAYYRLAEPERPVLLDRLAAAQWETVWEEERGRLESGRDYL